MVFQMIYAVFLTSVALILQSISTSSCTRSEVHSPYTSRTKTCTIFNYLRTIDHEANWGGGSGRPHGAGLPLLNFLSTLSDDVIYERSLSFVHVTIVYL